MRPTSEAAVRNAGAYLTLPMTQNVSTNMNRPLTHSESELLSWMLEHGSTSAIEFLPQLDCVFATPWRCPCGCASISFIVGGRPEPSGGMHVLGDFTFGTINDLSGIFVYEQGGVLAGLEVYGMAGDAPRSLPSTESLRPFG